MCIHFVAGGLVGSLCSVHGTNILLNYR